MRYIVFFILISFNLVASDYFLLSLATLKGKSSYEVWQNTTSLKSKLIFPIKATLLNIEYQKEIRPEILFSINYKTKINSYKSLGEDYDFKDDTITVYSNSSNNLDFYNE